MDNYMLAVIGNKDEKIQFFGLYDDYRHHLDCLKDYLYIYYPVLANKISADDLQTNEEIVIYLNNLGNIVYLNSMGYGLLFFPKEISESQGKLLDELFSLFAKTPIYIDCSLCNEEDITDKIQNNVNLRVLKMKR